MNNIFETQLWTNPKLPQLIKLIIKHYNDQKDEFAGASAARDTDADGQVLLRALLKGVINHTPACRHASAQPWVTRGNTQHGYLRLDWTPGKGG